jgi:hypothetical protein
MPAKSRFEYVWSAALSQAKSENKRVRSARMYTALLECVTTPGQDGMRFALFLFNFSVFKDLYSKQVSRATVRPWCHLLLRQQTWQENINLLKH